MSQLKRVFVFISILCLVLVFWNYEFTERSWVDVWIKTSQNHSDHEITVKKTLPQNCTGEVVPFDQKLLPVKGTKTLLVSAYQEHRTHRREVRVIAVVRKREEAVYHCYLCCDGQLHHSAGMRNLSYYLSGYAHGAADIMCPVPSSCETVTHIAVTSTDAKEDLKFLEVKNQRARNDSFPYNFTVCYSVMYEFDNVLQLLQGLEMLQILGVNKVAVYVTSHSPEVKHLLNYYMQKGLVDVISWSITRYLTSSESNKPLWSSRDIHYYGQIPALNDCVYRYMYESRYVALFDMDELILPQSVQSWSEMLPMLEQKYGLRDCYKFENHEFPSSIRLPPPSQQTLPLQSRWDNVPGVNILAHLYKKFYRKTTRIKTIVNPRIVFSARVHSLWNPKGKCILVQHSIARMYHTRPQRETELKPGDLIYDGRLLNYGTQLTSAVNSALRESGLLPQDSMT